MSDTTLIGGCLCGEVTSEIHGEFTRFYQCYCDRCQKKTGSAFASLMFTTPDKIHWLSDLKTVTTFDLPDTKRFRSSFCHVCGSQVPYVSRDGHFLIVPAGYVNGDPQITPSANIFWGERPCWFDDGKQADTFERYPL